MNQSTLGQPRCAASFLGLVSLAILLWALGQKRNSDALYLGEHSIGPLKKWADQVPREKHINLIFGSSNVAFNLDPLLLDSLCVLDSSVWWNAGQRGMIGHETLEFALHTLQELPIGTVRSVYFELNPDNFENWKPNWRNVQLLHSSSLRTICYSQMQSSNAFAAAWARTELFLQAIMMRAIAPVHSLLYPSLDVSSARVKGFYPPRQQAVWHPNSEQELTTINQRKREEDAFQTLVNTENDLLVNYPVELLHELLQACAEKDVEFNVILIPSAGVARLWSVLLPVFGDTSSIILGLSESVRPFSDPKYLRDIRHLNRRGVDLVTAEFAQQHLNR